MLETGKNGCRTKKSGGGFPSACLSLSGGQDGPSGLPGGLEVLAFDDAAHLQDILRPWQAPEHARLLEPATDEQLQYYLAL